MGRIDGITALRDLGLRYPGVFDMLWPFAEALMRDDAPVARADRELIAAYVSSLNQCSFCYGVHANVARAYGLDEALVQAMADDIATAPVDDKLKPMLAFARVLTENPARVTDAHYQALRDVGWDEDALGHVVGIVSFFNMMNRLVEGFGIALPNDGGAGAGRTLAEQGYDRADPER